MRKLAALFISLALVFPLSFGGIATAAVGSWALNKGNYERVLSDTRLYEIPGNLDSASGSLLEPAGMRGISPEAAAKALREVITPEYMHSQAARLLNQGFDFFYGRSADFNPTIDMTPIKRSFAGEAGKRFALSLAQSLPVSRGVSAQPPNPGALPATRPANVSVARTADQIYTALPSIVKTIPDTVTLAGEQFPSRISDMPFLRLGISPIAAFITMDGFLLLMAGGFWFLAGVTGGKTPRGRRLWLGWSLMIPSAIILSAGIAAGTGFVAEAVRVGVDYARLTALGYSQSFVSALIDAARTFIGKAANAFMAAGGIASGVSLGFLIWGWSTERDREEIDPAPGRRTEN
jgi:hypothetical protein